MAELNGVTKGPWRLGWGSGKSGPTCPWSFKFANEELPYEVIGYGDITIAVVPKQEANSTPWGTQTRGGDYKATARAIAQVPAMLELVAMLAERDDSIGDDARKIVAELEKK